MTYGPMLCEHNLLRVVVMALLAAAWAAVARAETGDKTKSDPLGAHTLVIPFLAEEADPEGQGAARAGAQGQAAGAGVPSAGPQAPGASGVSPEQIQKLQEAVNAFDPRTPVVTEPGTIKAIEDAVSQSAPEPPADEPPAIPGSTENECINGMQAHNQAIAGLAPEVRALQDRLDGLDLNSTAYQKTLEELNAKKGSLEYSEEQAKYWKNELDKLDTYNAWGVAHGYTGEHVGHQTRGNLIKQGIDPFTGLPVTSRPPSDTSEPHGYFDPSALEDEPSLGGLDLEGDGGNILDSHVKGHQGQQSQEAAGAHDLAAAQGEIEDASGAGDEMLQEAEDAVDEAGWEAGETVADAVAEVIAAESSNGVKDVVTDILTQGGQGLGSGLGHGAAQEVIDQWDKPVKHQNPPPAPPPEPKKPKKKEPKHDGTTGATSSSGSEEHHKPPKSEPLVDPGVDSGEATGSAVPLDLEDPVPRRKGVADAVYDD